MRKSESERVLNQNALVSYDESSRIFEILLVARKFRAVVDHSLAYQSRLSVVRYPLNDIATMSNKKQKEKEAAEQMLLSLNPRMIYSHLLGIFCGNRNVASPARRSDSLYAA